MSSDVRRALLRIAEHDVLELEGPAISDVLDLLVQKLGHVVALLITQRCKGRHASFGAPSFQKFRNERALLVLQHQLRVNEARSLGAARERAVAEGAIGGKHSRATLGS